MKTRVLSAILVFLISIPSVFFACGDKFLVSSRGTRYQKAPAKREPHAILIWSNPASQLPKALAGVAVDETLRKVGYQPTVAASATEFDNALNRGGWDLVILAADDAAAVSKRLPTNTTVLLPVVMNPTDRQLKQAKTDYKVVLKGPAKRDSFLDAVDQALAGRSKKSAALTPLD